MRVKTKLQTIALFMFTVLIVLVTAVFLLVKETRRSSSNMRLADEIQSNFMERTSIRDQYFLYREVHMLNRWDESKKKSDQLLRQAKQQFQGTEYQQIIELLIKSIDETAVIIHRIADNSNEMKSAAGNREILEELDKRLSSQLLLKATAIRDTVLILNELSNQSAEHSYRRLTTIVISLAGTVALFTLLLSVNLMRLIRMRLIPLHEGARNIGNGHLESRITVSGSDEFSELAHSVNAMTDKLVAEIEIRKTFEKELLEANTAIEEANKKALQKSEAHFRTLVNTIPDLIWLKDTDGVYLACNTTFERFFGAKETDILGKKDYDFVDKELADFFHIHDRKAIEAGRSTSNEEWITFADDGHKALFETTKTPMYGADGQVTGVLGIGHDITESRRAEEEKIKLETQLHQAQKMESIGSLAGGVAHDFNNKLSVILGCTYMAFTEEDQAKRQALLDEVRKAAEQSADLTRQLLTFARKQTITPKELDLNDTVTSMLKMLQRLIGENIRLSWQPAAELWPLKLDPSQIDQVLANLCVNARDSITTDGRITIETLNCVIDKEFCINHPDASPGKYVRLLVGDNGCGMDRETLYRIFEPFFTTKETGKGTGLGLATVFGIVKQNNGFINVYSEPGLGTTFSIYFPRFAGKSTSAQNQGMAIDAPTGKETILLVEDELAILNMASMILTKQGYTLLQANSPGEAIRLAREHAGTIDLLITDVIMPEMNGKDLANRLQSLNPQLKCLYMSGYTADVIAQHGVLDEGIYFIQKPFSLPDLAVKVREVLDGKP